jgi:hypothetical protein
VAIKLFLSQVVFVFTTGNWLNDEFQDETFLWRATEIQCHDEALHVDARVDVSDSNYHFGGLSMPRTTASGWLCEGAKMRPFYLRAADLEGVIRMVNVNHIFRASTAQGISTSFSHTRSTCI